MNIREFEKLVKRLREGVRVGEFLLLVEAPKKGRFAQEFNLDLFVEKGGLKRPLLHAKVFLGRGEYSDWVELFGISKEVFGENYFGSEVEQKVVELFSHTSRLFVEYFEDKETARELKLGVPPELSRLGFELARRGFTYVRDWYIPEGLMEGGQKLQGERATSEKLERERAKRLKESFTRFINTNAPKELERKARERYKILEDLWKQA